MKVSSVLPGYLCLAWFKWNHDEVRVLRKILLIWDTEHRTLRKVWNMWTRIHLCSETEAWLTKSTQSWTLLEQLFLLVKSEEEVTFWATTLQYKTSLGENKSHKNKDITWDREDLLSVYGSWENCIKWWYFKKI